MTPEEILSFPAKILTQEQRDEEDRIASFMNFSNDYGYTDSDF